MVDTLPTLAERTLGVPHGHRIAESGWQLGGFGMHRDSDPLEVSNFHVAIRILAEAAGADVTDVGSIGQPWNAPEFDPEVDCPIGYAEFGHWAVGWVRELVIRADMPELVAAAERLVAEYADYPVLDEHDYAEREWEANHPEADTLCYSDDPDCGCGREPA